MRRRSSDSRGFSLLEIIIAAGILIIVFLGLAQFYYRGRVQMGFEEDRRKATAVMQQRLDGIRRDFRYDGLAALNGGGGDTTIVSDDRRYTIEHTIQVDSPDTAAATVKLTVKWFARVNNADVQRTMETTTILGRSFPVVPEL